MDSRFLPHNTHLEDPDTFSVQDPQLRRLRQQRLVHIPALLNELPTDIPGIYTLGGGRQIGKTTLLKQWMQQLLAEGVNPASIAFFSGEIIDDQHTLLRLLQTHLSEMPANSLRYLMLDEVSYIRDWDKAIKYLADAGLLEDAILILSGSDLLLIQEARMSIPGRRGRATMVDFHLYPLSFAEVLQLKQFPESIDALQKPGYSPAPEITEKLFDEFEAYLIHGGYLTAINDMASDGYISNATLATYSDWIRGDMLKRGKQENYLREILAVIIKCYGSQISWNALARDLSIDHPHTVADYTELLARMDAVFIQPALLEHKLTGAPKKARKLMFTDPFIFHAIRSWLNPVQDPYKEQILPALSQADWTSKLVESCATTHFSRRYPTYYIKAEGEVDIAVVHDNRFWPVEVKWTEQIRTKDLKQIRKYANGKIISKAKIPGDFQGIPMEPLPLALLRI